MKLNLPSFFSKGLGSRVGLDVGSHSIKVVELMPRSDGFEIVHYAVHEIPKEENRGKASKRVVSRLIQEIFTENKIANKKVYLSVSGQQVVIRQGEFPKMPEKEMLEAVKWNAQEEVLFPIEGAEIDWHVMGEESGLQEVLTVVVEQSVAPELIEMALAADLKPKGVTVVPIALWDYDKALEPTQPGIATCYIDMGAERTRVYFVTDDRLLFSREIPNGGNHVTKALTDQYDGPNGIIEVDEKKAEELKKIYGLPRDDDAGTTPEGISLKDIREHVLPPISKQTEEIYRSIEYFKNRHKQNKVHRIIFSGGASGLHGLYNYLKENLESDELERCNVFMQGATHLAGLAMEDIKLMGPSLAVAAGLALGQADKINVLPEQYRVNIKKTLTQLAPYSAVPAVILILLFYSMGQRDLLKKKQIELKTKSTLLTQVRQLFEDSKMPMDELEKLSKEKLRLQEEFSLLPGKDRNPVNLPEVMEELARLAPENGSFTHIEYASFLPDSAGNKGRAGDKDEDDTDGKQRRLILRVSGQIFGDEPRVLDSLTRFLDQMKRSPVFEKAQLDGSEVMTENIYTEPGIEFKMTLIPVLRGSTKTLNAFSG